MKTEIAIFAAGCFWHVEAAFKQLKGVLKAESGYTGGRLKNPSYEDVCSDKTGHAEAVRVEFDPNKISFEKLLEVFWRIHDPTQKDRQGPDVGTQYRSVIFYHNEAQKRAAMKSKEKEKKKYRKPVSTEIVPAKEFYRAEEYHQDYYMKHGMTCRV